MRKRALRHGPLVFAVCLLLGHPAGSPVHSQDVRPAPPSLSGSRAEIYKTIGDVELSIRQKISATVYTV